MADPDKLKPCPFCGSCPVLDSAPSPLWHDTVTGCYYVFCNSCEAEGPESHNEKDAINAWNKREK